MYSGQTDLIVGHANHDAGRPIFAGSAYVFFFQKNFKVAGKLRVLAYLRDLLELL
jgi:hypothetical protein